MKRIVSIILALAMLLGMVSVSAFAVAEEPQLEHVTLEWYVSEDEKPGNQEVFAALNAYFEEKINTTVNFHFINNSEYSQKVSAILTAGQPVDIVNANSTLPYVNYANQDSFVAIEELLPVYAPQTYAMIPDDFWGAMEINGHIYGIPSYKDSVQMYCLMVNETLANALGMDFSDVVIKNYNDVIPLLYAAYEKRNEVFPEDAELPICRTFPDMEQWLPYETINGLAIVNVPGSENFAGYGSGETVFNKYATDEYRAMCNSIAQMIEDGVLPADCWYYDPDRVYTAEGKWIIGDVGSGYVSVAKNQYSNEWDTMMVPYRDKIATTNYLHAAVECVSASSANPERALMVLELINTDPWVATTLRFGTEGDFWVMSDEEGVLSFEGTKNEDPGNRAHYYWYGAQFGAVVHSYVPTGYAANYGELLIAANESAISETNMGFIFDPTPVQNEIAACNGVIGEFETNLKFGFIPLEDVNATIDGFLEKLVANGADKVVAEAQAQLDAWRAENK